MVMCALALMAAPMVACEIDTPAQAPSFYEPSTAVPQYGYAPATTRTTYAVPRPPPPAHVGVARAPGARAAAARAGPNTTQGDDPFSEPEPPLRAFVAGGETRFMCPAHYRARAADGTCACVSRTSPTSQYPLGDAPCGDGVARAEGNECIFTCTDAR
jgi:hypothetical protein